MALYNYLKKDAPNINVLLPKDYGIRDSYGYDENGIKSVAVRFGVPTTASNGSKGWEVANRFSSSAQSATGDVQFNKRGKAVTYLGDLNKLINR